MTNALRSCQLASTDFSDPGQVLSRLNENFPMERHNNMYFSAWYGVYSRSTRELCYANGGHPPAVVLEGTPRKARVLGEGGLVVGAMPAVSYETHRCLIAPDSDFYVFSDGVYEVERHDGGSIDFEGFVEILRTNAESIQEEGLARITREIRAMHGDQAFDDDFTILRVRFG